MLTIHSYADYKSRHYLCDIPYHTYQTIQFKLMTLTCNTSLQSEKKIIEIRNTLPTVQL